MKQMLGQDKVAAEAYVQRHYGQYLPKDANGNPVLHDGVSIENKTYDPANLGNWHVHPDGLHIIVVTYGKGYFWEYGQPVRIVKAGELIQVPQGVKHWHGPMKKGLFQYIAIYPQGSKEKTQFFAPITACDYEKFPKE